MFEGRTCPGDASCTRCEQIALDTSHLTVLARLARRLETVGGGTREGLFTGLVQVSACWREGRLVTAQAMYEAEMDPQNESCRVLEALNIGAVENNEDWSTLITFTKGNRFGDLMPRAQAVHGDQRDQERDCVLLAHAVGEADDRATLLVTNDEDLLASARSLLQRLRTAGDEPHHDFAPIHSLQLCKDLFGCGAIDRDVMEQLLISEFADVMEREMATSKRKRKVRRLTTFARELGLDLQEDEPMPDMPELFSEFLDKVDEDGS